MKAENYEKRLNSLGYVALKAKYWEYRSEEVRREAGGICFICGKKGSIGECNASHFYHSKKFSMMEDKYNIQNSCIRCNNPNMLNGNLAEYSYRLIKKFGSRVIIRLHDKMKEKELWNNSLKREMIIKILALKQKVEDMRKEQIP